MDDIFDEAAVHQISNITDTFDRMIAEQIIEQEEVALDVQHGIDDINDELEDVANTKT